MRSKNLFRKAPIRELVRAFIRTTLTFFMTLKLIRLKQLLPIALQELMQKRFLFLKKTSSTHYCQGGDMSRSISSLREFANQPSLFITEGLNA